MTEVASWVRDMWEEVASVDGRHLEIGMETVHPETGKLVKIVDGQYWGMYGLSNFWWWRKIMPDGSLSEALEQGYGWRVK